MSMKKMLAVVAAASLVAVAAPAFAANPFSDVPMNHWAYDAVEQMAAKGILEGYPNGTFKGNRAMTRYEIAQMVARMMANGVGGADADKLKALIVEFAPELEALGVKVDGFDGRLSKLEKGVGGVKIWGQVRLDQRFRTDDKSDKFAENYASDALNRYRIFLSKQVDDKTTFTTRMGGKDNKFQLYWFDTKDFLFNGLTLSMGKFNYDWDADDGMNGGLQADSIVGDPDGNFVGTRLAYKVGGVDLTALYGSTELGTVGNNIIYGYKYNKETKKYDIPAYLQGDPGKMDTYGLRAGFNIGRVNLSLNWLHYDNDEAKIAHFSKFDHYWVNLGLGLFNGVKLKGAYHMEKYDVDNNVKDMIKSLKDSKVAYLDDDPKAWRVILDIDQSALKFTSLWVEYAKYDGGFMVEHGNAFNSLGTGFSGAFDPDLAYVMGSDTKVLNIEAQQKWNSKFTTYEIFRKTEADDHVAIKYNADEVKYWSFGIKYQYSPALQFDLSYNDSKWSNMDSTKEDQKNKGIRFRTVLSF